LDGQVITTETRLQEEGVKFVSADIQTKGRDDFGQITSAALFLDGQIKKLCLKLAKEVLRESSGILLHLQGAMTSSFGSTQQIIVRNLEMTEQVTKRYFCC
jgi:hypothetical protein